MRPLGNEGNTPRASSLGPRGPPSSSLPLERGPLLCSLEEAGSEVEAGHAMAAMSLLPPEGFSHLEVRPHRIFLPDERGGLRRHPPVVPVDVHAHDPVPMT